MLSTHFWLNALLLSATATALPNHKRTSGNTASFDVVAVNAAATRSQKRSINAPFSSASNTLFIRITLGTSTIWSNLDTGSSDLVVFNQAALDESDPDGTNCPFPPPYDAMCNQRVYAGQGAPVAGEPVTTESYGDGEGVTGNFFTDYLFFGSTNTLVNNFEFFKGTSDNTLKASVFGTGFKSLEQATTKYDNLPLALTNQGKINAPIFSLWINSYESNTRGSMLYGGVDNAKFCGKLAPQTINSDTEFEVTVDSITTTDNNGLPVVLASSGTDYLLDSGSTSLYLPTAVFDGLITAFGGTKTTSGKNVGGKVPCSERSATRFVTFAFNQVTISVPSTELIDNDPDTDNMCELYAFDQGTDSAILGARFLASAYVVYDLLNKQIYLAQSITDASGSNPVDVQNSANPIPLTSQVGLVACLQPVIGTTTTSSITTSTTSSQSSSTTSATTTSDVSTTTSTGTTSTMSSSTVSSTTLATTTTTASSTQITTTSGSSSSSQSASTSSSTSGSTSGSTISSTSSSTSSGQTSGTQSTSSLTSSTTTSNTQSVSSSSTTVTNTGSLSTSTSTVKSSSSSSSTTLSTGKATSTSTTSATKKSTSVMTSSQTSASAVTWSDWAVPSTSKKSSTTWDPKGSSTWANWNGISTSGSSTSTTPKVTSVATWSAWNSQSLSYSSVTTTIYVCPSSKKDCSANAKTKTVTVTVIPYTTSTIYSTKTITVTNGSSWSTTVTTVPVSTTVCPYTSSISTATWSGVNSVAANSQSSGSSASASPASWSGANSVAASSQASGSGSNVPAASSWNGVVAASTGPAAPANTWVNTYTGTASTSYVHSMTFMAAIVGSVAFMLA